MVIGVVISIYYYFGWIREICFHPRPVFEDDEPRQDPWEGPTIQVCLKLRFFLSFLPPLFLEFGRDHWVMHFSFFREKIFYMFEIYSNARVAELVDAPELGSGVLMDVGVQVPPRAL